MKGRKIIYNNRTVVLLNQEIAPFSFLNTIYLSASYYKDGKIDERIFLHEEIHIKQKHSFDVLFIEVLKAFSWFNPFIYFYKNVIVTNHEFLADEGVILKNKGIKIYQELILNEVLKQQNFKLTHQFNFNNTKKRFIMMTKTNSKFAEAKKYLAIPAFAFLAVFFAERVSANNPSSESLIKNSLFSEDPYVEFKQILSKYSKLLENKEYAEFEKTISKKDLERLSELYPKLSNQQQTEYPFIFLDLSNYKKIVPTEKQLNDFLNDQKYTLAINGKETTNSELKKYKSSDFSNVLIYEGTPEPHPVALMTNEYFKKHVEDKKLVLGFISNEISPPINRKKLERDTISPKKNIEVKLEKKTHFSDSDTKKVQDLSIPPTTPQSANFVQAEFPSGANNFRNKVAGIFDGSIFKGDEGTVKSAVYIAIDENGNIDKVTAIGDNKVFNNEAERAVKSVVANTKWKPATDNGKQVRTTFSLPLTMTFTNYQKTQ